MSSKHIITAAVALGALILAGPAWAQRSKASSSGAQSPEPGHEPNVDRVFLVDNEQGYAIVRGGERLRPFLLRCDRPRRECELLEAELIGHGTDISQPYGLAIAISLPFTYTILRWDANGIIAQSDQAICMTSRLVLNVLDKSVTLVNSPKKPEFGSLIPCETLKSRTVQLYREQKP
jgi:hypothetical protein